MVEFNFLKSHNALSLQSLCFVVFHMTNANFVFVETDLDAVEFINTFQRVQM